MDSLNSNIFKSVFWSLGGNVLSLAINFISNIILAMFLSPGEFGQLAIIMFFIILSNVIASGGLGGALVRLPIVTRIDYSTVLVYNVCVSCCFFLMVYYSSDFIANYYDDLSLALPLKVLSFVILINSLHVVNLTKLVKDLNFRLKTIIQISAMTLSAILAISLAFFNFGIWSLVVMEMSISICTLLLLWWNLGVFLSFKFEKESFSKVFYFGMNTTLSSVINTAFNEVYSLVIAKVFSIGEAGYFYQARKLQAVSISIFNSLTQGPVYASLAKVSDNQNRLIRYYKKITQSFIFLVGLFIIFLYCNADLIITNIYGDKWFGSIYYFRLLLLASLFVIQIYFIRIVFKLIDKTKFILYIELLTKLLQIISIVLGVWFSSTEWLLYGLIVSSAIGVIISIFVVEYKTNMKGATSFRSFFSYLLLIFSSCLLFTFLQSYFEGYRVLFSLCYTFLMSFLYISFSIILKLFKPKDIGFLINMLKRKTS